MATEQNGANGAGSPASILVGTECAMVLNDGVGPFKNRNVTVVAVDTVGVAYKWDFRGSPREDFAPWGAVHKLSQKVGPTKDHPAKGWKDQFKRTKPSVVGKALVGRTCDILVRSLGKSDETRNTDIRGLLLAVDAQHALFVHNDYGNVFVTAVGTPYLVNIEFRERKDTKPPGVAKV